uniref:Glycosyltransferase family 92 protein n=1 Tax=Syphacia muris TaxID=451379 RepID=A0A0N5AL01_9BILA
MGRRPSINLCWNHISISEQHNDEKFGSKFMDDVDYAYEAINYMHDFQRGKAEIRPVVEQPKMTNYFWNCHLQWPINVSKSGWISAHDLHMFSATYDSRKNSLYPFNHIIQVLAVSFQSITTKCFCNIYDLDTHSSVAVEATVREIWQRAWDPRPFFYIPNLISCPVPQQFKEKLHLAVSISTRICYNSQSAVMVRKNNSPKIEKTGIAVCVKGLDFLRDISTELVEWIEAQYLFGAEHITVYNYHVHKKIWRVLKYYEQKGMLTLVSLSLPGFSPNHVFTRSNFIWRNRQQKRRHELIPYNDCFYRHIDTHKYILIVDIDELVVPLRSKNWSEMLEEIVTEQMKLRVTSLSVSNVFKFPSKVAVSDIPEYMHMLRNRRVSKIINKKGEYGKSFTNTDSSTTVFNHFALHRQYENVLRTIYISPDLAIKLHYKSDCPIESRRHCSIFHNETVEDKSLDKFANELVKRTSRVVQLLNLV